MLTMKINELETRQSNKAGEYTYGKVDLLKKDGSTRENVTIMAFGAQRQSVISFLEVGKTVEVTAVWDQGKIKILGPREGAVKGQFTSSAPAVDDQPNPQLDPAVSMGTISGASEVAVIDNCNVLALTYFGNLPIDDESGIKADVDEILGEGSFDAMRPFAQKIEAPEGVNDFAYFLSVPIDQVNALGIKLI